MAVESELRRVHESIKTASDAHFARVQRWDAELSKMRQMATSPDFNTRWEARMNERGYEREVKELDERYGNSLKELSQVIEKIERRL